MASSHLRSPSWFQTKFPRFGITFLSLWGFSGCETTISGGNRAGDFVDASFKSDEPGADGGIDGGVTPPQETEITLAAGPNTITPQNSVACGANDANGNIVAHRENHYYRSYSLSDFGITSDLEIDSVDIGIESAQAPAGSQSITLILHTLDGLISTAGSLAEVTRKNVTVSNQGQGILNVPISATVPAGATLVVEVLTPDGQAAGNLLFIGSNRLPETSPSYLRGDDCQILTITQTSQIGVAGLIMAIVLNVTGTHEN